MTAFCVLRLPGMVKRIDEKARSVPARLALGSLLALLLLMTTYPHLTYERGLFVPRSRWDKDYREALGVARELPGTVVCPEDPTIPFYGNGYIGLNLFSEKDARSDHGNWPHEMPVPVLEEMRSADFIVDIRDYWGENVDDALLSSLGFQTMDVKALDPDCYRICARATRTAGVSPALGEEIGRAEREQRSVH